MAATVAVATMIRAAAAGQTVATGIMAAGTTAVVAPQQATPEAATVPRSFARAASSAASSGGYGGHGGFFGGITPVIGVEADFDGSGISSGGALSEFANGFPYGNGNYVGVHSDIKYFGTVRGRLGVAFDRLLIFGTGGFAYADTDAYVNSASYGITGRKNNFHTGIAYGGGVEFALTNNLLLRAEYLHLDLNRKSIVQGDTGYATYDLYEKPSIDLVRAGLSYKFDFARAVAPPVIARY